MAAWIFSSCLRAVRNCCLFSLPPPPELLGGGGKPKKSLAVVILPHPSRARRGGRGVASGPTGGARLLAVLTEEVALCLGCWEGQVGKRAAGGERVERRLEKGEGDLS